MIVCNSVGLQSCCKIVPDVPLMKNFLIAAPQEALDEGNAAPCTSRDLRAASAQPHRHVEPVGPPSSSSAVEISDEPNLVTYLHHYFNLLFKEHSPPRPSGPYWSALAQLPPLSSCADVFYAWYFSV